MTKAERLKLGHPPSKLGLLGLLAIGAMPSFVAMVVHAILVHIQ